MNEYISREAVLKAFKLKVKNPKKDYQRGMQDAIDCLVPEVIADIPAADVQPVKHGKWIWVKDYRDCEGYIYSQYKCSCCDFGVGGVYSVKDLTHFCGNCGARMDLGDEKT